MKLQKASVELTRSATPTGYRLTLYMGLNSDCGPSSPTLLESLNDLYRNFNTHSEDRSVKMAEFCLRKGYKIYAQRVNTIQGLSSSRKFVVPVTDTGGLITGYESQFYSPLKDSYPEMSGLFIKPAVVSSNSSVIDDTLYSAVITFRAPDVRVTDNTTISDKFMLIVPRTVEIDGFNQIIFERMIGSGVDSATIDSYSSSQGHDVILGTLYYKDFKSTLISFFKNNCSFEVTEVTEDSIYLQSKCPIQSFEILNCKITNSESDESLISFLPTSTGMEDNFCEYYDDYKVCTLYSKEPDSLDDLEVDITKSLDRYIVDVYRFNSEGVTIYSESFNYSSSQESSEYISNLSRDSDLVDIVIHDYEADFTGTYSLKGKTKLETSDMYTNSVNDEVDGGELPVDIVIDNSESDQYDYIVKLKKAFPMCILMTGYDFVDYNNPGVFVRTCIVAPDVTWRNTGSTLSGPSYLLYLLPESSAGSDSFVLRRSNLPSSYTENCTVISRSDYGIDLMGSNVSLSVPESKFPIKSAVSVIAILNYLSHNTVRTEADFMNSLSYIIGEVNSYLGTSTVVNIQGLNLINHVLSAILDFYVDKQVILSYRVSAKLVV